jgi:hypothetical protein
MEGIDFAWLMNAAAGSDYYPSSLRPLPLKSR